MKTTKTIAFYTAIAAAVLTFTQCSPGNTQNANEATDTQVVETVAPESINGIKIAYVEYEALMTKYELAMDINKEMMRKEKTIATTIDEKGKALQAEQAEFTRKYQNNVFSSQERAQSEYERLANKEQELLQLQQSLVAEYESEQLSKHKALRDSVSNFIKEYNKEKGYDFILTKVGDEILYANEAYNITEEVVEGLNKRYNSTANK
jgi:outer membrane protein